MSAAVQLACTLFKLAHGNNFLICSETFNIGHNMMSIMLREFVQAIDMVYVTKYCDLQDTRFRTFPHNSETFVVCPVLLVPLMAHISRSQKSNSMLQIINISNLADTP